MDPLRNPYGPGAGTPPPELSGREGIISEIELALRRKLLGRPHRSSILVGLRGVGKTVLLRRTREMAESLAYRVVDIEVREDSHIATILVPALRSVLYELDRMEGLSEAVKRGFRVLRSFVSHLSLKAGGIEVGLSVDPEVGTADSGDLDTDISDLFTVLAEAARSRGSAIVLLLDELHYLPEKQFAALIVAMHRISQRSLPVVLFAAGLPTIRAQAGRAKSYAERLFEYPEVGALKRDDAMRAVAAPAEREGVSFTEEALEQIYQTTRGYPYFIQEWAYQAWNLAALSPISIEAVKDAESRAIERLDESFFRVRFDRLTPTEKRYLRAMAELGAGPFRSAEVAASYGAKSSTIAPIRASLIKSGMIYSPAHGEAAFTVPLFDGFLRRTMP